MVVPSAQAIDEAYQHAPHGDRQCVMQAADETKSKWLTRCFFEFEKAMGADW